MKWSALSQIQVHDFATDAEFTGSDVFGSHVVIRRFISVICSPHNDLRQTSVGSALLGQLTRMAVFEYRRAFKFKPKQ